jgi:branched-chain amino acid transport system ATP-binding protein
MRRRGATEGDLVALLASPAAMADTIPPSLVLIALGSVLFLNKTVTGRAMQAVAMSGGEQKQLEIGRALLLRPRVLLIDEASIGLSPKLVQEVMTLLRGLADSGVTVLMVEQNVRTALKYSNRALVLEMGRLALDKPAAELLDDPNLNRLFLGGHAPTKNSAAVGA